MSKIENIVKDLLRKTHEKQRKSKKIIQTEALEMEVIECYPTIELYTGEGGYKEFYRVITELVMNKELKELNQDVSNGKRPSLQKKYWLMPKYITNAWEKTDIAKVLSYVDLTFYLKNKQWQTKEEWERIIPIYELLKDKKNRLIIKREERSLMLFSHVNLPDNMEAEKFLSSDEGRKLLNRLSLSDEQLLCQKIREPFQYWINPYATNEKEVLIVEGLSTYNTLTKILRQKKPWQLGPNPNYVIWGEGYRIHNTISYLHELADNPKKLTIRYIGDIDYEGLNIYVELKKKNPELGIQLATNIYTYLLRYIESYSSIVHKQQRIAKENLVFLKEDLKEHPFIYEGIKELWEKRKRLPQECINEELLFTKEGLKNGEST